MNVEIPKEMRHFAQLKILTENARNHNERCGNFPLEGIGMEKEREEEGGERSKSRAEDQRKTKGAKSTEVEEEEEQAEMWTTT